MGIGLQELSRRCYGALKTQISSLYGAQGFQKKKKSKRDCSGSESNDNAAEDTRNPKHTSAREAERDSIVAELHVREHHGTTYSAVQYCLWAEMKIGHTWDRLEKHPRTQCFGEKRYRGYSASGELNEALTGLARSITVALSPQTNTSVTSATRSPTKTSQLRSKYMYMDQLSDLVITTNWSTDKINGEYEEQRQVVVDSMRKL